MSKEPMLLAQHGEWTTAVYKLHADRAYRYRVVTGSMRRHPELEAFCETWEQAKRAMADHGRQVKEMDG